jgi:putative transposase
VAYPFLSRELRRLDNAMICRPFGSSPTFGYNSLNFLGILSEEILMKNKRYSDAQIMGILKQAESGVPVSELCREHGMSSASFYKWRAKFGGMDASMISELKAMAEENRRLKRMYADVSMQNDLLKEALGKKH